MATKAFKIRQAIDIAIPPNELKWEIYGRIMLKTGVGIAGILEDTELPDDQLKQVFIAAKEILGEKVGG